MVDADEFINTPGVTTTPGAGATAILWDSTLDRNGTTLGQRHRWPRIRRATITVFTDQAATFFADTIVPSSSTWRVMNGGGAGEAIVANTYFERDVFLAGGDHRLRIVTGATPPTVWEISVRLSGDRGLAQ